MATPRPTLATSTDDKDVLASLAYGAWDRAGRKGEPEIPSPADLRRWRRRECPKEIRDQCVELHAKLLAWWQSAQDGSLKAEQLGLMIHDMPDLLASGQPIQISRQWLSARGREFKGAHPLAPLVWAWLGRRVPIPANDRNDPLFPPIGIPRQDDDALVALAASDRVQPGEMLTLPEFAAGQKYGSPDPTPSFPLLLWELASRRGSSDPATSWHVAFLAARIFVDVILDVNRDYWPLSASHGVKLPAERFRDFLDRIYLPGKNGRISWSRTKQLDTMLAAFELLEAPETRIPWHDPEHQVAGLRRVLVPLDVPRSGHADDVVQFAVHLPPGVSKGPLVDRPLLRRAGANSMPAWRLWLNLSDYWWQPGRTRVRHPLQKSRGLLQSKSAKQYPIVSDAQLAAWAFPQAEPGLTRSAYRKRLERAQEMLDWLQGVEAIKVVDLQGRRILPGANWAGWTGGRK